MEPRRLRLMLLASGTLIRTILINQSLSDGSNLKPWSSPSMGQGDTLSPTRGDTLAPIHYHFITYLPRTCQGQSPLDLHFQLIWPQTITFHSQTDCWIVVNKTFFVLLCTCIISRSFTPSQLIVVVFLLIVFSPQPTGLPASAGAVFSKKKACLNWLKATVSLPRDGDRVGTFSS